MPAPAPELAVVLLEDTVALLGLLLALFGVPGRWRPRADPDGRERAEVWPGPCPPDPTGQ